MSDHSEGKYTAAKTKGLVVVLPGDHDLFIDIDDALGMATFATQVAILNSFRPCTWVVAGSPSGKAGRSHVTVTFDDDTPLTNIERLALQAMLGSDRLHELLSYRSHFRGDPEPTCFFEKPSEPA